MDFSGENPSFRKEKLVTEVRTMDDTLLDCDDVEKLFTLLTKKKYILM